jgi:hypothetical protein
MTPAPAAPALAVGQVWRPTKGASRPRRIYAIAGESVISIVNETYSSNISKENFRAWIARHRAVVGE